MNTHRQQQQISSKPPARTGPEVAHISMSPVARFSMSLDSSLDEPTPTLGMVARGKEKMTFLAW